MGKWQRSRHGARHEPQQHRRLDDGDGSRSAENTTVLLRLAAVGGVRRLAARGIVVADDADDIGHNLSWEAPRQLAADIDRFVRTGEPTRDLYRSDAPQRIQTILEEPGKAIIVSSRP